MPTPSLFPEFQSERSLLRPTKQKSTNTDSRIELNTIVLFGKYKGMPVSRILDDEKWLAWYSQQVKKPLDTTVLEAISTQKFLAR
jgi:hypothetical protein